jgi:hypothetical protein
LAVYESPAYESSDTQMVDTDVVDAEVDAAFGAVVDGRPASRGRTAGS